ncbi:MAG: hypothetical protein GEV12_07810 [Micromonosporaceae bacterium]|nr:hypothetical protein [Micromonosporaceae bacterium]
MASTLTELLRGQPDQALAALLRARPDLMVPVPADLDALAARAQSRISVTRVLDRLDRFQLEILDALRLTRDPGGLTSLDEVLTVAALPAAGVDATRVRAAVQQLHAYLLVFGPTDALRVVPVLDEILGPYPAGLGRPAEQLDPGVAELAADPARLRRTLLSAPPAARAVLDRLAAGPPVGTVSEDPAADPTGDNPVGWLVSRRLLATTSPEPDRDGNARAGNTRAGDAGAAAGGTGVTVELPRELGLLLRRDTGPLGALHPAPPVPDRPPGDPGQVDAAGAGQAMEAVRLAGMVLEALAAEPAPVLRSGGMGIREVRRLARAAGLTEPTAGLLVEVGAAAGLIGETGESSAGRAGGAGGAGGPDLRPATGYDGWGAAPIAVRWHALAAGWLSMTRQPGLVGQRDGKDRLIGALGPEAERTGAPAARRTVLEALAELPPGAAPTPEEVVALVGWSAPRRTAAGALAVRQLLTEAATLGLTGQGALTSYARALLVEARTPVDAEPDDDPLGVRRSLQAEAGPTRAGDAPAGQPPAATALAGMLPAPVGELLVQADLTVVVPGPPEPALAAELELVAEPESAGGASVYRVTRSSLRRALDAGYAAEGLHALFARRSRTPVPQGLTYLVDDVARAHGGLRVGPTSAYLRSDDEALVAQVLTDRRLAPLGLRRLAPTVLTSPVPAARMLAALREAGYAPVPEDASGAMVLARPRARRAPPRPRTAAPLDPFAYPRMSTPRLLGIVEDIRRGDAAARAARRAPVTVRRNGRAVAGLAAAQAHTEAMAVLQQAVRDKALVWVGYVDAHGASTSRLLRPVSIGAGYLRAEDERTDTLHTLALHRITAATLDAG